MYAYNVHTHRYYTHINVYTTLPNICKSSGGFKLKIFEHSRQTLDVDRKSLW